MEKIIIFFLLLLSPSFLWSEWINKTIDSVGSNGGHTSIALDSFNNPHISYFDGGDNNNLKYAKWTGVLWSTQTIDSLGEVGLYPSIVLDSSDNPCISYVDDTDDNLKYAKWTGDSWATQTVDSSSTVGWYTSIALDSFNNPHISYFDYTLEDLKYAKWTGDSWVIETVDSEGWTYVSIALDSFDNPHISYFDGTNNKLKYAKWTGVLWSTQTVDSTGFVGKFTSIALDSLNNPHISYLDQTNYNLKYAKWTGDSWAIETVESTDNVGYFTSIAIDSFDNPHISYSYSHGISHDLRYAKWMGGSWSVETIDSMGTVGYYTSIIIDIFDNPYISYVDLTNENLKYAKWNNVPILNWTDETDYVSDGLNPETGDRDTSFVFRVKYADDNNDAPSLGYPKVHIKKGESEISGSPFAMTEVSTTTYTEGKLYSFSKILTPSLDYTYHFEAQDIYASLATGTPLIPKDAPYVSNNAPTLSWTGETDYVSDGLNPETGDRDTSFVFRLVYTDEDNDAPITDYPKIHIKKGESEISGSPFAMTEVDADDTTYDDGKLYSFSKILTPGLDYTYHFEAKDIYSWIATGEPLTPIPAPDMSNNAPTLSWTGETDYVSDGLNPEMGDRDTSFIFRLAYTDIDNDVPNSGYPKLHIKKDGSEISGSPFTMSETDVSDLIYTDGKFYIYSKVLTSTGTDYTYYFEAQDICSWIATGEPLTPINAPDVSYKLPSLDWTGETDYVSDGLNPETGDRDTSFIFRLTYTDIDNDAPTTDYPKVHIKKGESEISGSPFAMTEVDADDTIYTDGKLYSFSKILTPGLDYTYYFEAKNIHSWIAIGEPLTPIDAPDVSNNAPELDWTGETDYVSDGLNPETGDKDTSFVFRLTYTDIDNDAPITDYPKVHIKKGESEISGSPFAMMEVDADDTNYDDGKLYSFSRILTPSLDYTYHFEAKDIYSWIATGEPLTPIAAPDVSNNAPTLSWTGETDYVSDGLNPETGDRDTSFVFRLTYTDIDNDAPTMDYPKVHVKKGGVEISGSPFTMSETDAGDTIYTDGKLYSLTKTLVPGSDYTYYFEAQDLYNVVATGMPLMPIDAPDISNNIPTLDWTGETNYIADGLNPKTGNSSTSFIFRIKYTDSDNDAPNSGYPKVHIKKGGAEISGSPFAMSEVSAGDSVYTDGKLYFYSKSINICGSDYTYYFEAQDIYNGVATGIPLSEKSDLIVIRTGTPVPEVQKVKIYHGVFKPGQNEKTNVSFNLSAPAVITIKVYDSSGRKIKDLYKGTSTVGLNTVQWDGRNNSGQRVSSGVYAITINGGGINQTKRVVVIR